VGTGWFGQVSQRTGNSMLRKNSRSGKFMELNFFRIIIREFQSEGYNRGSGILN
jgi:hypothetical protein